MRVQGQIKDRGEDLGGMDEPSARLIQAHRFTQTNATVLRVWGGQYFTWESENSTTELFKSRKLEAEWSRGSGKRRRGGSGPG